MRRYARLTLGITTISLVICTSTFAQSPLGSLKSGIGGRVILEPALRDAKLWPVEPARSRQMSSPTWVRRGTGQTPVEPLMETNPKIEVVLIGVPNRTPKPREVVFKDDRFLPAQIIVTEGQKVKIANQSDGEIFFTDQDVAVAAGKTALITLAKEGVYVLSPRSKRSARLRVRVTKSGKILTVGADGAVGPLPVEAGEYELVFFHGTKDLFSREIKIAGDRFVAFDATVSANENVVVSIKDGGVRLAP